MKVHYVFHVSLLKSYNVSIILGILSPKTSLFIEINDEQKYKIIYFLILILCQITICNTFYIDKAKTSMNKHGNKFETSLKHTWQDKKFHKKHFKKQDKMLCTSYIWAHH